MTTLEQSKPANEARDSVLRSGAVSSCNDLLGCGDVVRFKWGRLSRCKTGRIIDWLADTNQWLVYARGGHHCVNPNQIVKNLSK